MPGLEECVVQLLQKVDYLIERDRERTEANDLKLYTPAEVAAHWQISKQTVYKLIKEGKLPVVDIKADKRVRHKDLTKFINKKPNA